MNVSLPNELKSYVDQQVGDGGYGSTSEYVRDLIRRDKDRQHLRRVLIDGAAFEPRTDRRRGRTSHRFSIASDPTSDHVAGRSVQLRERAATDIEHAADYYRSEAGADVALRFIDAIERAVGQIARLAAVGKPSIRGTELEIPDLRVRPIARFPYLVFYVTGEDVVDVWRVLHTKRDIPSAFAGDIED